LIYVKPFFDPTSSTLATAGYSYNDKKTNRPVFGKMTLNIPKINLMSFKDVQ